MIYDVIIVGGGPAGLTAAIYARRAAKSVLIIEKNALGGQIAWSPHVENFPGFSSISGMDLGNLMADQAINQGTEVELEEVCSITEDPTGCKIVECISGIKYMSHSVIIATGAKPRLLGIQRESDLTGSGINYCAVCDGAFYAGSKVAVAGGGNSALQDSMLLSEICEKVYIIHRRDAFRGEQRLVESLSKKSNVEFILNTRIVELLGEDELTGIVIEKNNEIQILNIDGLFIAIGHEPDNNAFKSIISLDRAGYADSAEDCITRTPGVFVAGDCRKKKVHQLTTAVSDGATAALAAINYIDQNK